MPVQQPQCSGSSSSMYTSSLPMAHGHTSPTYSQSSASTQLGSGSSSAGSSRAPDYGHPPQVPRFAYRQRPTERLGGMGAQASVERTGGGGSNHDTPKPNRERKSKQPSTGPDGLSVHTQRKMYVYGLEGYIAESQNVLMQHSIKVPQPKRAATSEGVTKETRDDMLTRMSETIDNLQTTISQKEAVNQRSEESSDEH